MKADSIAEERTTGSGAAVGTMERQEEAPQGDVIEAQSGGLLPWGELWRYRELLYFLTWRDIKIRYKQTALGVAWAVLQPFMTMIVFSLFFGRLAGMEGRTGGVPYPIYVFVGLLPWTFFANAVSNCGSSVVNSANLITKVYFPRLIIPIASVGAGLVDLAISFVVLLGMMLAYRTPLSWQLIYVPLFVVGVNLATMGVGMMLSALTVSYRDFRYIVPFMIQLWMFVTPVIYPSSLVPGRWRWLLSLNPLAGQIDGFRSAFLARPMDWLHIGISLAVSVALFFGGAVYFRSVERRFADII